MTYTDAYNRLQEIIQKLEGDAISVDELSALLKEAKELVQHCQERLRTIKSEVESDTSTDNS